MFKNTSKDIVDLLRAARHGLILRGLLPGKMAAPFIIAGGPRSGSTFLQTLLNSHPNVVCMHELLKETVGKAAFCRHYYGRRGELLKIRERAMEKFLREIFFTPQPKNIMAIGFKALYSHPDGADRREEAWQLLAAIPDLKVIWIERNPFESVISFAIARKSGAWIGKRLREPIRLDPDYILRRLMLDDELARKALKSINNLSIHKLDYANLIDNYEREMVAIQKFLGLDCYKLETKLRKQNTKPVNRIISNIDEIYKALEGTPWELYIDN